MWQQSGEGRGEGSNLSITLGGKYSQSISGLQPIFNFNLNCESFYCEAQARVRQGSARDGSQGKRPQSLKPSLELTSKLVVTHHHHQKFILLN